MNKNLRSLVIAATLGTAAALPAWSANLTLNNVDPPGSGFNDPAPATPVGGNAGTTVGEQRLIAYRKALELWGKTLASDVTVVVRGSFAPLTCSATSAVLAQAGTLQIFSDFPNAPLPAHWFHAPLANAIVGEDLTPGPPDVPGPNDPFNDDLQAFFNSSLGGANCLPGTTWYYGLDNNAPAGTIDFLDTFMHEVSHGLGFANFVNEATGVMPLGQPDVYMANTLDLTTNRPWDTLTSAEIVASAIRTGQIVWYGPNVSANAFRVLAPGLSLQTSGSLTQVMEVGTASFGPLASPANFTGELVVASDDIAAPNGGTPTDGCEALVTNVTGKIAVLERGLCAFAIKAKNAQNGGAIGLVLTNTQGRPAEPMGGTDATITIPSVMVGNADGNAIRSAVGAVNAALFSDPARLQGTAQNFVRLYAPNVVQLGSSLSHFDTVALPNLLMEPFINTDLRSAHNLDLTPSLMQDVGWKLESLKIGECDTRVANALPNGELLHVAVEACLAGDPAEARRCIARLALGATQADLLPASGFLKIMRCVPRTLQ